MLAAEYREKRSLIQVRSPTIWRREAMVICASVEVQKVIADALDISLAEVSGVMTFIFYPAQREHTIRVCLGRPI